ncbi:esterase/lipase family protein [uncultured Jatrophihabitans sp.]|uniref:esterase/lipase family protein n=1 Tax=uncultured Jatrophihabitans sp. TaxID=1610747 RepID=UPI0035C9F6EA
MRRRRLPATLLAAVACIVALALTSVGASAAGAATHYTVGTALTGDAKWVSTPDADPAGVNTGCTPSAAHPRPVVLLEGTTSRIVASFDRLGPELANAGYCVYGLNYGSTSITTETHGVVGAMGDIAASARQLQTFVTQVRARTGAAKVDLVGWSQGGGPMPRYYLQDLGGAKYVHSLVGLSPSNYGTTFFGVLTAINALEKLTGVPALDYSGAPAFQQQLDTDPFITHLNAHGDTVPGVSYTVIQTRYDDVVTPYTNAFLHGSGARNILLQDACPLDATDHLGIPYDDNAEQYVLNALGANDPHFKPTCKAAAPGVGTL